MKNPSLKAFYRNAIILACIIGGVRLLHYLLLFKLPAKARTVIYMIFPHDVFENIRILLFGSTRSFLRDFPLFTLLLAVLLVIAAVQLKKNGKTMPLKLCYFFLILSIVLSIPGLITGYHYMVDQYNKQMATPHTEQTGLLGLIDAFARVSKPSLPLLIVQVVILLAYAAWCGWQIKGLYALDKKR